MEKSIKIKVSISLNLCEICLTTDWWKNTIGIRFKRSNLKWRLVDFYEEVSYLFERNAMRRIRNTVQHGVDQFSHFPYWWLSIVFIFLKTAIWFTITTAFYRWYDLYLIFASRHQHIRHFVANRYFSKIGRTCFTWIKMH